MTRQGRLPLSFSQFITMLLLGLLAFSLVNFLIRAVEGYRLQHRADALRAAIEAEREEQQRLLARKAYVASPEYQARLAHELGLYAPDERRLVVLAPPDLIEPSSETVIFRASDPPEPPIWQQWWDLFFGAP